MMPVWELLVALLLTAIVVSLLTALYVHGKDRKKLDYMLDAFEDDEYNFSFASNSKYNRSLNRIKWIVERRRQQNEQDSWVRLIRVLTHEIMNTVTPIASLSEALSRQIESSPQGDDAFLKSGLDTISSSSKDLIRFVTSYRELAGVSKPVKKGLVVDDMIKRVIDLTQQQCLSEGVQCYYRAITEDILIYADESQISRVLINLIKNAIQAKAKQIDITAQIDSSEYTVIKVLNNGNAISPDAQDQIFIPFFTTKREGTGIGLSLSRQIMRAHNGSIELSRSDAQGTEFTLTFR